MKKKVLSLLVSFAMLFSMLPTTALAVESDDAAGSDDVASNSYYEFEDVLDPSGVPMLLATGGGQEGTITPCYTRADGFWGEGTSNSGISFVVELYEGEEKIASATLGMEKGGALIDGDVYVTWSIPFDGEDSDYWDVEWAEGYPKYDMNPDTVKLVSDDVVVATNEVQYNAPDNLNKIVAIAEGYTGGVVAYTSLVDAIGNFNGRQVNVLRDVTEEIKDMNGATLTTNVEGGVTITSTYSSYVYANDLSIGKGVTVKSANWFFETDGVNTIEGVLEVGSGESGVFYHGYDAKTTVQNGGQLIVNGSTILRYNESEEAGLYIYGDGDDETVEYKNSYYIGAYSGTFYAEDANVECGYFLLKNSYDSSTYADIDMTLDNSTLTVVGTSDTQDSFIIDDQASLTLKNGSEIADVRDFSILADTNLALSIDSTSSIEATNVSVAENVPLNVTKNSDGTVTLIKKLDGSGTEEDPILINNLEDLIAFRDTVDTYQSDGSNQFKGKYVKLMADIDLYGINWDPIGSNSADHGSFKGVFDGNGHTISNLYVEQAGGGLGLFARTGSFNESDPQVVIKNLTLDNVTVKSTDNGNYAGGVVGNATTTNFENVHVTGKVEISGRGYVGGIAGHGYSDFTNVSVKADADSTISSTFWCAGGVVGYHGEGNSITGAAVEGLTIKSAAGGIGAVAGMSSSNEGTQPCSYSNLSAKNVAIQTYTGDYGDAYAEYALGYLVGGDTANWSGTMKVENVTFACSTGTTNPPVSDAVASIDDVIYFDLQSAIDAAQEGETVTLLRDVTIDENTCYPLNGYNEGVYYEGDKSFTINLGGHKLTNDSAVNDYLMLFKNAGSKANEITIKNGTIEAASTAYCAVCTSGASTQQITINLEDVALIGNNSNGSVVKVRGGTVLNVKDGTTITGKDSYLGIECISSTANIYDGAEIYMNGTTSYNGCLVGVGGNGTVNIYGGYGKGAKGGIIAMTSGGTINISGGEWIADTDDTKADNESVLIAQNDKNTYTDAGNSVINVTEGTFTGGFNCYGNAEGDAQLVISGGEFTENPKDYLAEGYTTSEYNGTYEVIVASQVADKMVAEVNGTKYLSLEKALAAAKDGDTITLLADVTADSTVSINKSITLDGNNHAISGSASPLLKLSSTANITVQNATLTATSNVVCWNYVSDGYTHTYKDCQISGGVYGIHYDGSTGGKVVIDGCTIDGFNAFAGALEQVTIKDTTFDADKSGYAGANLWGNAVIENVTLVDEGKTTWLDVKAAAEVTGGKVVKDGEEKSLESYLDAAVKIGTTYYDTLAKAVTAAEDGDTIILLQDVELTCESGNVAQVIDKSVTVDGNNHTITFAQKAPESNSSNNYRVFNVTAGDVTLKNLTIDLSESTHGSWSAVHNRAINVLTDTDSVTLDNVDIIAGIHYGVYVYDATEATVTIKDSSISGYNALSIWTDCTVNVVNSDLTGKAVWNYLHGVINIGGGTPTITVDEDSSITAVANPDNDAYGQYCVYVQSAASANNVAINTTDLTKVSEDDPVIYVDGAVARIDDTLYKTLADAIGAIAIDGSDTTIKLLSDAEVGADIAASYGTGKVIFTADTPVTVKQTAVGTDFDFTVANAANIVIEENVTIEVYDNSSGMYLYYGPSLTLNGTVTGGQNWGALYLFQGKHTVSDTGKISTGRVQLGYTDVTVNGEVDTNYLLVEGSTFTADGATVDAGVIYDNNNGTQRWGASTFDIKNSSDVTAGTLTLSYADSKLTIDMGSTLTATTITGAGQIIIDAEDYVSGDTCPIIGNASTFTGTIQVINNKYVVAEIDKDGDIVLVEKQPAADLTYGGYVGTSGVSGTESYRENIQVDLYNVYAAESLVVELWSGGTKLSTTTLRDADRDDENAVITRPITGSITANIVVSGRLAGSWDTEWHVAPNSEDIPDTIKAYADGGLVDTWNGGFTNDEEKTEYIALTGVTKPVHVTGVSLSGTTSVKVGNTVTLTATVAPDNANNKNVTWTSSNEGVATVDDGVVTGVAAGTATITVTTEDGGFTASCTVTVSKASTGGSSGGGGGSTSYTIAVEDTKNGDITVSPSRASKGTTVTITVDPDNGYELDELTVLDKNGDEVKLTKKSDTKYTFTMPSGKVTIEGTFAEIEEFENPFVDVAEGKYYYDAVLWAAENGITGGTTATTFEPATTCTRAQTVTFLWRAAGSPEPESTVMPFTDVVEGSYYYDAVLWAVENGITTGTSATTFEPYATVTRAQNVTFLWRWAESPTAEQANPFTDVAEGKYYHDAVIWAAEQGITSGTTATTFSPNDPCLRSQIVTFLYRYLAD